MVFKQIKNKKSQNTITGLVIGILIAMAIFSGTYLYVSQNTISAGDTLNEKYSESYTNLTNTQGGLKDNIEDIRANLDDIKEATEVWQVAWNGLKGLGNTLKLPISLINSALATWDNIIMPLDIFPGWVLPLAFIGVLAFIVFLIVRALKGEPAM